jgi:hypothetical protein
MIFVPQLIAHDGRMVPKLTRRGVVLLVVIALLALFSAVGLSFVYYADSESTSSQFYRESTTNLQSDINPEMLLSYFLGQMIYDADDYTGVYSALRGHSLWRNMYGLNYPNDPNNSAYSGIGRLHYNNAAFGGADDYPFVNYMYYPGDGFIRYPERIGPLASTTVLPPYPYTAAGNPNPYFAGNVSYNYPDLNNMFLATMNANGEVLIQSYYRPWTLTGGAFAKYQDLRPNNVWNPLFITPDADGGGNVKNLEYALGVRNPAGGYFNNDSWWLDLGYPIQTAPNGKKYKPLFAPLILPLDGKVNLNVAGNIRGTGNSHASNQGFGTWEINIGQVMQGGDWPNLFLGLITPGGTVTGRYGVDQAPAVKTSVIPAYPAVNQPLTRFYSPTDLDSVQDPGPAAAYGAQAGLSPRYLIPGDAAYLTTYPSYFYFGFPFFDPNSYFANVYNPGLGNLPERVNHPSLFNYFNPNYVPSFTWTGGPLPVANTNAADDRIFADSNLEALYRYSGTGSPAMTSDLFQLCQASFSTAANASRARRLVTTRSMDLDQPGAIPSLYAPSAYAMGGATVYPVGPAVAFPPLPTAPPAGTSEFLPNWRAATAAMGRLDLNRLLTTYPPPDPASGGQIAAANMPVYNQAVLDRQQFAWDIFRRLAYVTTGYDFNNPANAGLLVPPALGTPPSAQWSAFQWLAQLAVNMVDYIDNDDINTAFAWCAGPFVGGNPTVGANLANFNSWVFGTEMPRVLVNEAYIELDTDPASANYIANFWVELLNPMQDDGNGSYNVQLQFPPPGFTPPAGINPYSIYRLVLTDPAVGPAAFSANDLNIRGDPNPTLVKAEVADFLTGAPVPATACFINPANSSAPAPAGTNTYGIPPTSAGNAGFYVVAPGAPTSPPFPYDTTVLTAPPVLPTLPVTTQAALADNYSSSAASPVPGTATPINSTMSYSVSSTTYPTPTNYTPNIFLRRLACPYLPPQTNPANPNYNPYITIDYLQAIGTNDGRTTGGTPVAARVSRGRTQPYAAAFLINQLPDMDSNPATGTNGINPLPGQPQHTMFRHNGIEQTPPATGPQAYPAALAIALGFGNTLSGSTPAGAGTAPLPFNWLVHLDRYLTSPVEILQVSIFPPFQLTHNFVRLVGAAPGTPTPYCHNGISPNNPAWFDSQSLLYRAFEFFEVGPRAAGVSSGARVPGKININDVWDPEPLLALVDQNATSSFPPGDVTTFITNLINSRSPTGVPTGNDVPYLSFAAPFAPAGAAPPTPYPNGCNIYNTLLRAAGAAPDAPVNPRLVQNSGIHPYRNFELFNKIFNNITTRSNTYAVFLTVGFFEVVDDTVRPAKLGQEIGRSEGRQVRHRMFAIIDRTGMAPFSIPSTSASVTIPAATAPGVATITIPAAAATGPAGLPFLRVGMEVELQVGGVIQNALVTGVVASGPNVLVTVYVTQAPVAAGAATIIGPRTWPRYNVRLDPLVVPYFNVIQ